MKTKKHLIITLALVFNLSACSSLYSGGAGRDEGFYGRATPSESASPLPVEIAREIQRITEEGTIVYNSDVADLDESKVGLGLSQRGKYGCYDVRSCRLMLKYVRNGALSQEEEMDIASIGRRKGPLMRGLSSKGAGPLALDPSQRHGGAGKTIKYIVRWGDTLMEIAFEKYANYLKWKDIYRVNKHKMESPEKMQVGTELTIENVKYVYIKKDGKPYLIKKEDTLKSISQKLYGTPDRWKEIWKNNPQLVRNPKKIYAGFTLYYNPDKTNKVELRQPAKEGEVSEAL